MPYPDADLNSVILAIKSIKSYENYARKLARHMLNVLGHIAVYKDTIPGPYFMNLLRSIRYEFATSWTGFNWTKGLPENIVPLIIPNKQPLVLSSDEADHNNHIVASNPTASSLPVTES